MSKIPFGLGGTLEVVYIATTNTVVIVTENSPSSTARFRTQLSLSREDVHSLVRELADALVELNENAPPPKRVASKDPFHAPECNCHRCLGVA